MTVPENNEDILNDIEYLQTIETDYFNQLADASLTTEQKNSIIQKINDISTMRINLYKTLGELNNFYLNSLDNSRGALSEQIQSVGIVENELNNTKQTLQDLEESKNNTIRLIEINQYYGDKYQEHTSIVKILIFMLIPILILTILYRYSLLPDVVYYILFAIVIFIGLYFFFNKLVSLLYRDSMNYQEYDWSFSPSAAPKENTTVSNDPWKIPSISGTCVGEYCCHSGTVWNSTLAKCEVAPKKESFEGMINNVFTKHAKGYIKPSVVLGNVSPMVSDWKYST